MTTRVMLDIETLGTDPGATICSVGAVAFDETGLGAEFHESISLQSCEQLGLEIDADTLEWWLDQDAEPRQVLQGGAHIEIVLDRFSQWLDEQGVEEIWANSPSFDCVLLEAAYDLACRDVPWEYWQQRDMRTLSELPVAADVEQQGTEHDALDDARYQARVVAETLDRVEEFAGGATADD